MIIDRALVDRVNAADVAFTEYNARRTLRVEPGAPEHRRFGEVVAVRDATQGDGYYNRVIGLDEAGLPHLDAIVAYYADVNLGCTLTLTPDRSSESLLAALTARGFLLKGTDTVFLHRAGRFGPPTLLDVSRATDAELDRVFDLWADGGNPIEADARAAKRALQLDPAFPIYVARIDGEVVAMAAMFLHGGIAWLGNAGTEIDYRGRGCQQALLWHRLAEAERFGCDLAVTDTAFGTTSHRNVVRCGFALGYMPLTLFRAAR